MLVFPGGRCNDSCSRIHGVYVNVVMILGPTLTLTLQRINIYRYLRSILPNANTWSAVCLHHVFLCVLHHNVAASRNGF